MINFNMLMSSIDTNTNANKLTASKLNVDTKSINFKDTIENQKNLKNINADKETYKNMDKNSDLKDDETDEIKSQLINIPIKDEDKEKLLDEISNIVEEDLSDEDTFNILNIFLALNTIETNDISFENIEFLKVDSFLGEDISMDNIFKGNEVNFDFLGRFVIEENNIKIPVHNNEDKLNNLNIYDELLKIDSNNSLDDKYLNIDSTNTSVNANTSINIEDIFQEIVEDVFKLELKDKEFDKTDSSIEFNKIDSTIEFNKADKESIYSKLSEIVSNIEDVDAINYKNSSINHKDSSYFSDSFNNFLMNQRVVEVKSSNDSDSELDLLLEIQSAKNEVTNNISPYLYRLVSDVSDKINANIQPEMVRYSHFESDLANTITYMKNSSLEELTIQIKPKELGEITINLIKKDGLSEVVIVAEKEDLVDSLKRDISRIESEIKKSGLTIDNISIEVKKQESSTFDLNNNNQSDTLNSSDSYNDNKRESRNSNEKDKMIKQDKVISNEINKMNDSSEIDILA